MRIRDAAPSDAEAVARLVTELGYPATSEEAAVHMARYSDDPRCRIQVAEIDGSVVGLVATNVTPVLDVERYTCRISSIVVSAARRGDGIGTALLDAAEAEARSRGAARLELSSGDWRPEAHGFYLSRGFTTQARSFTKRLRPAAPPAR